MPLLIHVNQNENKVSAKEIQIKDDLGCDKKTYCAMPSKKDLQKLSSKYQNRIEVNKIEVADSRKNNYNAEEWKEIRQKWKVENPMFPQNLNAMLGDGRSPISKKLSTSTSFINTSDETLLKQQGNIEHENNHSSASSSSSKHKM